MTPENNRVRLEDVSEMYGHHDHPQTTREYVLLLVYLICLFLR